MNMENFDEVIFDEEDELLDDYTQTQTPDPEPVSEEPQSGQLDDLTNEVLRLKGISDPSKIKFEDETGAVIERDWNTLSRTEQLNILASESSIENELSEDELQLLNTIRSSGMSINDYMSSLQQPVEEPVKSYKIDQLSDEDVFALDLLEKVGSDNITDEEIEEAIKNAKQNETLFKKTVDGLRKEYIRLQEEEEAQQANEEAAKREAAYNQFANSIYNEIKDLNSFAGQELELSQEDSEELAEFMLRLDNNGVSAFGYALQDPRLFTKAAFWLLNEEQIVEELNKQMQYNYKRGYEAAKNDLQNNKKAKPQVVFNSKQIKQSENKDDFFIEDEEW